ncbi:MAG: hypothetical protein KJO07_17555 [Deltaproteobacteria bacterium]|nr:hypothetical protein [Deltaproteobacteria bacterium]
MKRITIPALLVLSLAVALTACGKKDGEGGEGGGESGGGGGGSETVDLPKLGLKADVPKGSQVSELMGAQMIQGPGITVTIDIAKDMDPKTIDDAKKEATETYSGKNLKEEKLDDGFILTFENKGGMGTNYFMIGRREIDGKAYKCNVTAPQDAHQKSGAVICKTLKK